MESITTRVSSDPFAETGTIMHEGRAFTSGGAWEAGDRVFGYVRAGSDGMPGTVGNWDGTVTFGRIVRSTMYRVRTGFGSWPIRMRAIRVRRPDGSEWSGRYGVDWRDCVTLRRVRGAR